jgi:ferredoxin-NADP reductase
MGWQEATVAGVRPETARATTFRLRLPEPMAFLPGQHVVLRLTAADGYQASRSYSIASAPDGSDEFEITVERLAAGEVSTFLHDDLRVGDVIEVRGPIGGWFVWTDGSAVLVGGGSGVVPLMAMLRYARRTGRADSVRLAVSVRTPDDLLYAGELPGPETTIAYTREAPAGAARPAGRLTAADVAPLVGADTTGYICGSAGFADAASAALMTAGLPAERIRVERFGPTG